ncbi:MAG: endonuclease III domain-containing protein [Desulfatiglandales bacterium]
MKEIPVESPISQGLKEMFELLFGHFGPQHWWPGETAFEVMVGAVLTQNTNWKNVEKAIENLKARERLTLEGLHRLSLTELAEDIRPAGYFNIKARRLKNLIAFIADKYDKDLALLLSESPARLREGLLSVKGIGPETADSILLYAAERPVFVIDAYTYRILRRHGMAEEEMTYDGLQALFMDHLPDDPQFYNEFHALIVRTGKEYCRKKPHCERCPLYSWGPERPLFPVDPLQGKTD